MFRWRTNMKNNELSLEELYEKADCENRILPEGFQCNYDPDYNSMIIFAPKGVGVKVTTSVDKETLKQVLKSRISFP